MRLRYGIVCRRWWHVNQRLSLLPMVRKGGEGMSWVDSCDDDYALDALKEEVADLKAENAELRKELAVDEPLFETLNDANDRLLAENAELRELVRDMWHELDAATQYDAGGGRGSVCEFAIRMRELGVEV